MEMLRGLQLSDNPAYAGVTSFGNIQALSGRRRNSEMWPLRWRNNRSLLSLSVAVEYTCKVACRENDFMVFMVLNQNSSVHGNRKLQLR